MKLKHQTLSKKAQGFCIFLLICGTPLHSQNDTTAVDSNDSVAVEVDSNLVVEPDTVAPVDVAVADTTSAEKDSTALVTSSLYTKEDIEAGRKLFSGETWFANGGPSCITCHNVNNDKLFPGGLLAKDLTKVYSRQGEAGLSSLLASPPFPAMASSYGEHKLTTTMGENGEKPEVALLIAFLKHADEVSETQKQKSGNKIFLVGGTVGLAIWLSLLGWHWRYRKRGSVKKKIFDRQTKSIY
jgi:mono/diheme cytochrome c family protein